MHQELASIAKQQLSTIEKATLSVKACSEYLRRTTELVTAASFEHDSKEAAKVVAKEELARYIDAQIRQLNSEVAPCISKNTKKLVWTGDKISLAELIYALDASGVINNGAAALADLTAGLQKLFNVDLGNFYHKFQEIKERKFHPTKFMSFLAKALMARIERDSRRWRK